jgi:hypothetical protein
VGDAPCSHSIVNSEQLLISTRNLVLVPTLTERSLSRRRNAGGSSFSSEFLPLFTLSSRSLEVVPKGDLAVTVYMPASAFWTSSRVSWTTFAVILSLRRGSGTIGAPSLDHIISISLPISYNSAERTALPFSRTDTHCEPSSRNRGGNFSSTGTS